MRRNRMLSYPLAAWALLLVFGGCDPGTGTLTPVGGAVSFKGAPMRTGTVVFSPDPMRGTTGPVARAQIRPDGTYRLETGELPGAVPGWHRVTIVALEIPAAAPDEKFVVPRSLLPDKYRDPELSGLVREVKAGQENRIDFDLD